jgi:hypothetical protein
MPSGVTLPRAWLKLFVCVCVSVGFGALSKAGALLHAVAQGTLGAVDASAPSCQLMMDPINHSVCWCVGRCCVGFVGGLSQFTAASCCVDHLCVVLSPVAT